MAEKIKIVWTSEHLCIRVIKLSKALLKTGRYEIHQLARQISYGSEIFDKLSFYHGKKQFKNLVKELNPDLFIHSNEPNHQLNWIREVHPKAKILLDAHDLDSIRLGMIPIDEHKAISNCDGILFVSREVKNFILELHEDQLMNKPYSYLEHYCNEEFLTEDFAFHGERRGLVYQGGAQSPPYKDKAFKYRHLYPIFKQLVNQGHELHVMAGNPDVQTTYANIGAFIYPPQLYSDLMNKMRHHKWGLITWNNVDLSQTQVNLTRTNKEQEYLACGLPIIVFGAPATAEYVKEKNIGLVFDKIEDITPQFLDEAYPELKANVDKLRPNLSMESRINILEELISRIINN